MVNPKYFFYIRNELNDVPEEYVGDEVLLRTLLKAERFLEAALDSDSISPSLYEECLLSLATYYTYLNYTSIVARRTGAIPEFAEVRAEQLKEVALSFLRLAGAAIDDSFNLQIDTASVVAFDTCGIFGER